MKDLFGYIKLGRLNKPIADKIGRKPADIYIDYDYLRHIENGKKEQLIKLKFDALTYVKKIIDNFFEIRSEKDDALILVANIEENDKNNIAIIELQLIAKHSIYTVKTAMMREKGMRAKELLLWSK